MSKYRIKGQPWNYPGAKDVSDCKTAEEVMTKAKLDYEVGKAELFLKMPIETEAQYEATSEDDNLGFNKNGSRYSHLHGNYGTYRKDVNVPLGFVKDKYTIVQNIRAFEFFDDAIGKNQAIFQRAGYWKQGARIFVSVKLPDTIEVKDDVVDQYLVFTNSHDGSEPVNILFTPIRIVCQNTLNAAIRTSMCSIQFRHTQNIETKIAGSAEVLGITKRIAAGTSVMFNQLAKISVTDDEVKAYILNNALSSKEIENSLILDSHHAMNKIINQDWMFLEEAEISTRKANLIATAWDYYHNGIGQQEIIGTMWGLYNMYTGISANVKNVDNAARCNDLLFGGSASVNTKHLENMWAKKEELFMY